MYGILCMPVHNLHIDRPERRRKWAPNRDIKISESSHIFTTATVTVMPLGLKNLGNTCRSVGCLFLVVVVAVVAVVRVNQHKKYTAER